MTNTINEKIGAWLIADKQHTREYLAKHLGMTRQTLSGRLSGKSEWTWREVMTLCKLTNSTPNAMANMPD